jgi:hypothetical protein
MSKRIDRPKVDPPSQPVLPAAASESSSHQEALQPASPRNAKRRVSGPTSSSPIAPAAGPSSSMAEPETPSASMQPPAKKSRTNTPWTAAEEQRLKTMREAGNSWADIAKVRNVRVQASARKCTGLRLRLVSQTFPSRTEGSVKKHWYKVCYIASTCIHHLLTVVGYALRRFCRRRGQ